MDDRLVKIYQLAKTVFTTKDLALVWKEQNAINLNARVAYYVRRKALIRLRQGIFAKDENYDPKELATSIYLPSYISFETALREEGIIFQHYETIFVASRWSRTIKINQRNFTYRKLKDELLYNPEGVIRKDNYSIAGKERAFLDMIYLFPDYYFDNLNDLNWKKCFEMAKIYKNKQMAKRLNNYRKKHVE